MSILEFFLQTSLSIVAVFLYHYLHATFQGGFLLVAILGSLRIIVDPTSAYYAVLLMVGSLMARWWGSEFTSLVVVVLLITSLVSKGFHPVPQEELEVSPRPREEDVQGSPVDKAESETKSPGKKPPNAAVAVVTPKRAARDPQDAAQKLKDAKEAARHEAELRIQERTQQLNAAGKSNK